MASSGNFCTLNPLAQQGGSTAASTRAGSMSNGNVKYVNLTGNTAVGTFGVTSGKWYFEVYINSFNADNGMTIGWANDLFNLDAELGYNSPSSPSGAQAFGWYAETNKLMYGPGDGGSSYNKAWGGGTKVTDGDIVGIYLDADNGKFWASKNGTVFNSGDPSAGTGYGFGTGGSPHNVAMTTRILYPAIGNWSGADATVTFNFGQDSSFQGAITAGTETDGNGFGNFKYSTEGFLALCSANLPISDDIDPAQTDDDFPQKLFNTVLYTGNGSTQSITGLGFQPDAVWIKKRSADQVHQLYDSSRGVTKQIYPSQPGAEATYSNTVTSLDSDGFSLGSGDPNNSSATYVAWCWRANGGTTASNSNGSITSTVQSSTKAGFSIITYTGTGSNATIGHGLSSKPDFMLFKRRSSPAQNWKVYHTSLGATKVLTLNSSSAVDTDSTMFNNTEPTNSVISIGTQSNTNTSSANHLCYAWHNVEGYSKFSSYEGNGSTDGTFVYTGFRPRMVFLKQIDGAAEWACYDTARDTFNMAERCLEWDLTAAEKTSSDLSTDGLDFLSNGFKFRGGGGGRTNQSGRTFIYGAWADVPFKYNNTF